MEGNHLEWNIQVLSERGICPDMTAMASVCCHETAKSKKGTSQSRNPVNTARGVSTKMRSLAYSLW